MRENTGMKIKKKLVIATGLYPPDIGGPATYVRMLEEKLPEYAIECVVVPFSQVRHLPKVVRHVAYFLTLLKQVRGADAVYALDPISVGIPALWVSKVARKPFIIRLGGDYAWEQGQQRFGLDVLLDAYTADKQSAPWQVRMLASLQGFVVRRAKKVIVPSEYMKSIVATWGVKEEALEVIYSALFPLEVPETKTTLREAFGYDGTLLFSAARLTPWKGYDTLIDVVHTLRTQYSDMQLIIAGDGPEEAHLKQKVRELGAQEYIIFTGRLSKQQLGAYIKASDLFVLHTAYEGLSHQLLEVMHLGVPVVTTNVGGNPELIENGVSGILVPYNDTEALQKGIVAVLNNPDDQQRMVAEAQKRTNDFSDDTVMQQFVTLIQTTLWNKK